MFLYKSSNLYTKGKTMHPFIEIAVRRTRHELMIRNLDDSMRRLDRLLDSFAPKSIVLSPCRGSNIKTIRKMNLINKNDGVVRRIAF